MKKKYYLTTPIYYVNDIPHIGHAYTTVAADVLARYKRMLGYDTLFLTGTDEHGQKVEKSALISGETPQIFTDRIVKRFKDLWLRLNISYDDFIRTTEERHKKAVTDLFLKIKANGDIYKGEYEDWYCIPCESFFTDLQLKEGKCPDCNRTVEKLKEESYFFRMSKYQGQILAHIETNPDFIQPESKRNEIISFIKSGLKDLSISRTSFKWGIPVPGDDRHIIYVWFDALTNYLTAAGFPDDKGRLETCWPADVHIIGKDILRFHAVYWPTFLLSAGIPLPRMVFSHGWWTIEGQKMSKSKGNVVDPLQVVERFGVDPFRYFLLRDVPFGLDGDFSEEAMITRHNTDLANDLGNLLSRTLTMIERYRGGRIPPQINSKDRDIEIGLRSVENFRLVIEGRLDKFQFHLLLGDIWYFINLANRAIEVAAPWKEKEDAILSNFLYVLAETLRIIALYLYPFMPSTANKIHHALGLKEITDKTPLLEEGRWGMIRPDTAISKGEALFPRIEKEKKISSQTPVPPVALPQSEKITIEDFAKIDLRVGLIKSAERVKGSEKLIKLMVDLGTEERQVLAGIGTRYAPEELPGKRVIVVCNLEPRKMMGMESQGMLLAAGGKTVEGLATFIDDIAPGTKVK
ncbi:MAG: methionine--tRNA ligase [Nitrospirae bacterium]|nr:methionine--tRNA ligase [Nitrospirota bacterium]